MLGDIIPFMSAEHIRLPKVTYSRDLDKAPYIFNIKREEIPSVLAEAAQKIGEQGSISATEIGDLNIKINRDDPSEAASFTYLKVEGGKETKEIALYGDAIWEEYNEALETSERIAKGKESPRNQFSDLLYTKRLEGYLVVAPEQRGLKFAKKVLDNAANRQLSGDLIHELSHFLDRVFKRHRLWYAAEDKFERIMDLLGR